MLLFLEEVSRFENCEYALDEFDHHEHLRVAWTYLRLVGFDAALARMRQGLLRFSAYHNAMGYNETITVFWMRVLMTHCEADPAEVIQNIPKEILFRHFSRECVMSEQARRQWIEPDLLPMPE